MGSELLAFFVGCCLPFSEFGVVGEDLVVYNLSVNRREEEEVLKIWLFERLDGPLVMFGRSAGDVNGFSRLWFHVFDKYNLYSNEIE